MNTFKEAFKNSNNDFQYLIKNEAAALLGLFLGCEFLVQFFLWLEKSSEAMSAGSMGFMLMRVTVGLLQAFLILMIVYRRLYESQNNLPRSSLLKDLKTYSAPLVTEGLRAMGVTLLWTLALIIPGVYKYIRLNFVSNAVLLDPDYLKGSVDALEQSEEITKGIWWPLFALLMGFGVALWWLEYMKEKFNAFSSAGLWICLFLCISALNLYLNVLLYEVYSVRKKGLLKSTSEA